MARRRRQCPARQECRGLLPRHVSRRGESWNLRDTHMFETLCQLLEAKGPDAKAVVWAHNSHIGNAAHTEMGQVRDELNIGQLCKEKFGRPGAADRLRHPYGTVAARPTGTSRWR
jgi:erythromycin esterase-like protein